MIDSMPSRLVIATRKSPLALWQSRFIKQQLQRFYPALAIELLELTTTADQFLESPLSRIGGKGLFVKELEQALLSGAADIAVHSLKDVPMHLPENLMLAAVCLREDPRDALVVHPHLKNQPLSAGAASPDSLDTSVQLPELPFAACVGTSSLRRRCQLLALRPDLLIEDLRGNVNTRLAKLEAGIYDAIVLAAAGLIRLSMQDRIHRCLPTDLFLPAVAQGALAIECRAEDARMQQLVSVLIHEATWVCVTAERAMNATLEGGCQVPIAGFAEWTQDSQLVLNAWVGDLQSTTLLRALDQTVIVRDLPIREQLALAAELGVHVGQQLLSAGAGELLMGMRS